MSKNNFDEWFEENVHLFIEQCTITEMARIKSTIQSLLDQEYQRGQASVSACEYCRGCDKCET